MNTPEPEYARFVMVLRHPLNAALSYAAYSLSNTMSHDNVVPEEEMRAHMAKASPLRHVTNQFHYYIWLWKLYMEKWTARRVELGADALIVRYEDLKADCIGELGQMASFLGAAAGSDQAECACGMASLEKTHRKPRPYTAEDVLTA